MGPSADGGLGEGVIAEPVVEPRDTGGEEFP